MIEKVCELSKSDNKSIEKVLINDNLHYMHAILPKGESLPIHKTNANVYMTVLRGTLSIGLENEKSKRYEPLKLLNIPYDTLMDVKNEGNSPLELIIVKTPVPGDYY